MTVLTQREIQQARKLARVEDILRNPVFLRLWALALVLPWLRWPVQAALAVFWTVFFIPAWFIGQLCRRRQ
jgi:hypothetical protein